ncbi:hypothetical protein P691DRAFT_841397 [Macrolepiota fuliginosa MF-IS2]|uniref:Uncharacterized protein n=1 Tax=Macrolepiota fuliginosa MF-IS2 TaxID=1400762 RepID=A0A9P6CAS7_9AGAR|nr:hypothetical protein P691DRAFT_841397 [Macrolepiota fuliginosa MF-IS2]
MLFELFRLVSPERILGMTGRSPGQTDSGPSLIWLRKAHIVACCIIDLGCFGILGPFVRELGGQVCAALRYPLVLGHLEGHTSNADACSVIQEQGWNIDGQRATTAQEISPSVPVLVFPVYSFKKPRAVPQVSSERMLATWRRFQPDAIQGVDGQKSSSKSDNDTPSYKGKGKVPAGYLAWRHPQSQWILYVLVREGNLQYPQNSISRI